MKGINVKLGKAKVMVRIGIAKGGLQFKLYVQQS